MIISSVFNIQDYVNTAKRVISFKDFLVKKGRVEFVCTRLEDQAIKEDHIYYDYDYDYIPRNETIALTLITFCGQRYNIVHMDLVINCKIYQEIELFTRAEVIVKESVAAPFEFAKGNKITLNFSGGFDSLAALCLLPDDINLVSMDFGEGYVREKEFFELFNPYMLRTNFRNKGIRLNSDAITWTFMGVGSILFAEMIGTKYDVFGTILDTVVKNNHKTTKIKNQPWFVSPFSVIGMQSLPITHSLSEIATAMIICTYKPELVNLSLRSLGGIKSEKFLRKHLITRIVKEKFNKNVYVDDMQAPEKPRIGFGQNLAMDFLYLYILKNIGISEFEKYFCGFPEEYVELAGRLSLDFYERFFPNYLPQIPHELRYDYLSKLAYAGVYPYTRNDWNELDEVVSFLLKYHSAPKLNGGGGG